MCVTKEWNSTILQYCMSLRLFCDVIFSDGMFRVGMLSDRSFSNGTCGRLRDI